MRRHSVDPVALLAGSLFIVVGAAYLGGGLSDTKIEARWVLPTVLITLGFAGLVASLVNLARQRRSAGVTAPAGGGSTAPAGPGDDATATMAAEPAQPEATVELETVELETVELETVELETPPVGTENVPDDEPRDRS